MEYNYTEEQKLYDKISEASLINLYSLATRNNNKIELVLDNTKNKKTLYFIEIANLVKTIDKDVEVFVSMSNKIKYLLFKLKNRHLIGINFKKKIENNEELNKMISFMEEAFEVNETIWEKIYIENFERKKGKRK